MLNFWSIHYFQRIQVDKQQMDFRDILGYIHKLLDLQQQFCNLHLYRMVTDNMDPSEFEEEEELSRKK